MISPVRRGEICHQNRLRAPMTYAGTSKDTPSLAMGEACDVPGSAEAAELYFLV